MQRYVIVAAGGSGKRMGSERPKQFLPLQGKPIIAHTLDAFYKFDSSIQFVVALPNRHLKIWNGLVAPHAAELNLKIVDGGAQRFHSVQNALALIDGNGLVAVQDAVRPFASQELIKRCFEVAEVKGSAIPTIPITDSIRQVKGKNSIQLDRSTLRAVQTPQCFHLDLLKRAYEQSYSDLFTDDASVVEHFVGLSASSREKIELVEGEPFNIKITTQQDLALANAWLSLQSQTLH